VTRSSFTRLRPRFPFIIKKMTDCLVHNQRKESSLTTLRWEVEEYLTLLKIYHSRLKENKFLVVHSENLHLVPKVYLNSEKTLRQTKSKSPHSLTRCLDTLKLVNNQPISNSVKKYLNRLSNRKQSTQCLQEA
jgi:hypothetical protein